MCFACSGVKGVKGVWVNNLEVTSVNNEVAPETRTVRGMLFLIYLSNAPNDMNWKNAFIAYLENSCFSLF